MTNEENGQPGGLPGEGYTVAEAAARLGISVKAVRERIRRGTLTAHHVQTAAGRQWRVTIEEGPGSPAGSPASYPSSPEDAETGSPIGQATGSPAGSSSGSPHEVPGQPGPVEAGSPVAMDAGAVVDELRARLADRDREVEWLREQLEKRFIAEAEQRAHAAELARLLEREQHARAALEARHVRALPPASSPAEPAAAPMEPVPTAEASAPIEAEDLDAAPEQPRRRWWWPFG